MVASAADDGLTAHSHREFRRHINTPVGSSGHVALPQPCPYPGVHTAEAQRSHARAEIQVAVGRRCQVAAYTGAHVVAEPCARVQIEECAGMRLRGRQLCVGNAAGGDGAVIGLARMLDVESVARTAEEIGHIAVLPRSAALDTDAVEAQIRHAGAETVAARTARLRRRAGVDTGANAVHVLHGEAIADVAYLPSLAEIQQTETVEVDAQTNKLIGGYVGMFGRGYELVELGQYRCLRPLVGTAYVDSYHDVRREIGAHDVERKIVVDAAVVEQPAVNHGGLEHAREAHGGAHRPAEVAAA